MLTTMFTPTLRPVGLSVVSGHGPTAIRAQGGVVLSIGSGTERGLRSDAVFGGMRTHLCRFREEMALATRRWSVLPMHLDPGWIYPLPAGAEPKVAFVEAYVWPQMTPTIRSCWPGVPVVVRSGGNDVHDALLRAAETLSEPDYHEWVRTVAASVDLIVTNTSFSAGRVQTSDLGGVRTATVTGGATVASVTKRRLQTGRPTVVVAGRFVHMKGIDDCIEAVSLAQQRLAIDVVFVGDGPERPHLERLAEDRLKTGTWQFTGLLSQSECIAAIAQADVLLSMSRAIRIGAGSSSFIMTETMGRSICEALVAGVPVVATSVGGVPEVVVQGAGTLIPEGDCQAAAARLIAHIEAGPLDDSVVERLRDRYGWPRLLDQYEDLFDQLVT